MHYKESKGYGSGVNNEWTLEQRLVKLQMLAKIMKGEEVAREISLSATKLWRQ